MQLCFVRRTAISTFNNDLSSGKSLQDIAQSQGLTVVNSGTINFASFQLPGYGVEHKVIATAVSMDKDAVSEAINGENGVYIVKITSTNELVNDNVDPEKARLSSAIIQRVDFEVYNALKENANVSDSRSKFY